MTWRRLDDKRFDTKEQSLSAILSRSRHRPWDTKRACWPGKTLCIWRQPATAEIHPFLWPSKECVDIFAPWLGWISQRLARSTRRGKTIIILGDTEISKNFFCDHGIAAQSILLGAREKGLGGCIHASVKRDELSKALGIPPRYEILLALSLGNPKEVVVLETVGPDGGIKYWRDSESIHHVPKRSLDDIIIG